METLPRLLNQWTILGNITQGGWTFGLLANGEYYLHKPESWSDRIYRKWDNPQTRFTNLASVHKLTSETFDISNCLFESLLDIRNLQFSKDTVLEKKDKMLMDEKKEWPFQMSQHFSDFSRKQMITKKLRLLIQTVEKMRQSCIGLRNTESTYNLSDYKTPLIALCQTIDEKANDLQANIEELAKYGFPIVVGNLSPLAPRSSPAHPIAPIVATVSPPAFQLPPPMAANPVIALRVVQPDQPTPTPSDNEHKS